MAFVEILLTILTAFFVGILFYYGFKSSGPWGTFWSFLLILVLAGLAAEVWVTPVGPAIWGYAWFPTLLVILIFALLMAAATPPRYHRRREFNIEKQEKEPSKEETVAIAIGGFFWILLLILLGITMWGIWI